MDLSRSLISKLSVMLCLSVAFVGAIQGIPILQNNNNHETSKFNSNLSSSSPGSIDDMFTGLYTMFGGGNPQTTPEGLRLIEGDMAISNSAHQFLAERKAIADNSLYWPNGEVIYSFHESIKPSERSVIEAAMQHWRQHTCLTFRPRTASDYYYIRFRSDTQGCWSLVGRQTDRIGQGQDVSIGTGCANLNVVVHEIGHVIGFYHEQSRSDRDQHIDIVWNSVQPGYALQFRKESDHNLNIPYDLTSTMQYPQWAFSREIFEKNTIVAKNPAYQRFLSKNYPLSFRDRILANHLYQCVQACQSAGSCQNGGYLRSTRNAYGSSGCSCDCPPNFTGSQCETRVREDYYDTLPCGGVVTSEGRIETPGYPMRSQPAMSCMWDIRAPQNKVVSIRFDGFEFAPRFSKAGTKVINKCFNETVEIRINNANINDGVNYCGSDIMPGTVMRSDGPRAVIIITANDKMIGKGLSARILFRGLHETDEQENDDEHVKPTQEINQETKAPASSTPIPIFTIDPSIAPVVQTIAPVLPPQPPTVVTSSSLLEEYQKESRKTLPPVGPFANQQ